MKKIFLAPYALSMITKAAHELKNNNLRYLHQTPLAWSASRSVTKQFDLQTRLGLSHCAGTEIKRKGVSPSRCSQTRKYNTPTLLGLMIPRRQPTKGKRENSK